MKKNKHIILLKSALTSNLTKPELGQIQSCFLGMEINVSFEVRVSLVCSILGLKIVGQKDFFSLPLYVLPRHYM